MKVLEHLQDELEAVHAVQSEHRVQDFVVSRAILDRMGVRTPRADEEVLVLEEREQLSLALYLAPHVLASIEDAPASVGELLARGLSTFCLALEGVSHFLYLVNRAAVPRPVSLLELEVQAEIDKFALATLHLWRRGARGQAPALLRRLFDEVSYPPELAPEAAERYRTANRLARNYCMALLRHVEDGRVEGLLGELRRSYRLGGSEKIGHVGRLPH